MHGFIPNHCEVQTTWYVICAFGSCAITERIITMQSKYCVPLIQDRKIKSESKFCSVKNKIENWRMYHPLKICLSAQVSIIGFYIFMQARCSPKVMRSTPDVRNQIWLCCVSLNAIVSASIRNKLNLCQCLMTQV